jgi:hypothetical protein
MDKMQRQIGCRFHRPGWDERLWEFCLRLPSAYLASESTDKWLARMAHSRIFPDEVCSRRKVTTFSKFSEGGLYRERVFVKELFERSVLHRVGLLDRHVFLASFDRLCDRIANTLPDGADIPHFPIWYPIALEVWLQGTFEIENTP